MNEFSFYVIEYTESGLISIYCAFLPLVMFVRRTVYVPPTANELPPCRVPSQGMKQTAAARPAVDVVANKGDIVLDRVYACMRSAVQTVAVFYTSCTWTRRVFLSFIRFLCITSVELVSAVSRFVVVHCT